MIRIYLENTSFGDYKNLKYVSNPHNDPIVEVNSMDEIFNTIPFNKNTVLFAGNPDGFEVDFTIVFFHLEEKEDEDYWDYYWERLAPWSYYRKLNEKKYK